MTSQPNNLVQLHGPWSLSKADCARQCPYKFTLKYIQKVKEPEVVRSEGRVGSAAHKMMELVLNGQDQTRAFKVAAIDEKLTTNEMDDLATFNSAVRDFMARIKKFKEKYAVDGLMVEHQFGLTIDLKPTTFFAKDVFFRGVFDLAMYVPGKKDVLIFDHKSGTPAENLDRYSDQLTSYTCASKLLFPEVNGVQTALHYLKTGEVKYAAYTSADKIDPEWLIDFLNKSVATVEGAQATPGWQCSFCGYASKCDAYKATKSK